MFSSWLTSSAGRHLIDLVDADRPAWLWTQNGEVLDWFNDAARMVTAKIKHDKLRPGKTARPIPGQVRRLMRLGSFERASTARIPFTVGGKPLSLTCTCIPLVLQNQSVGLLIIGQQPISAELFSRRGELAPSAMGLLPRHVDYVLARRHDGSIVSGSEGGLEAQTANPDADIWDYEHIDDVFMLKLLREEQAETDKAQAGFEPEPDETTLLPDEAETNENDDDISAVPEPDLSAEDWAPDEESAFADNDAHEEDMQTEQNAVGGDVEDQPDDASPGRLSALIEAMGTESGLYDPLSEEDEIIPDELAELGRVSEDQADVDDELDEAAAIAGPLDVTEDIEPVIVPDSEADNDGSPQLWRVTGTGPLRPLEEVKEDEAYEPAARLSGEIDGVFGEEDNLDEAARYNFDELSKILTNRITTNDTETDDDGADQPIAVAEPHGFEGDLVILNRLPLGILMFKDERIVFANRSFIDLVACDSLSGLRELGLHAVFPQIDDQSGVTGPIVSLQRADGVRIDVDARLQTVPFRGEPVLMVSSQPVVRQQPDKAEDIAAEVSPTRNQIDLANQFASARQEGLLELTETGLIVACSDQASAILGHGKQSIVDRPLSLFSAADHARRLDMYFARTRRTEAGRASGMPHHFIQLANGAVAHIFGLENSTATGEAHHVAFVVAPDRHNAQQGTADAALLARLSRGVRRPLNTIMGFGQLIAAEAFGPVDNVRYEQYAQDIVSASREIEGQIDELDDYARIESGQYESDAQTFDLGDLLEECERLVRRQAAIRQVLVRSAISEKLPHVRADHASMRKAVLNILASAIDKTNAGGKVVMSASSADDGSIEVHVRDGGMQDEEFADRFAVFREGTGQRAEDMVTMRSSMGLALTRSLLSVNACALSVGPSSGEGNLLTLSIPRALIVAAKAN